MNNLPCGCTDQMIDDYIGLQDWEIPDEPDKIELPTEPNFCVWIPILDIPF